MLGVSASRTYGLCAPGQVTSLWHRPPLGRWRRIPAALGTTAGCYEDEQGDVSFARIHPSLVAVLSNVSPVLPVCRQAPAWETL